MRYTVFLGLAALVMAAQPVVAREARTPEGGIYDNVRISTVTGDAGGMAVNFRPGPSPAIVVTVCEGECYGGRSWPVTVEGNRIAFTVCDEDFTDQDGKPVPCKPIAYSGVFESRNRLVLTVADWPWFKEVLNRAPTAPAGYVERLACGQDHC